ncbi:MAG: hypothetical protein Q8O33_06245 [Pseudomonadota bacterium]|nr:hypothetical protein [Pseudomonadota bacterium]
MSNQLHFFSISALHPQAAQAELNAFLAQHRVVALEKQWVAAGLDYLVPTLQRGNALQTLQRRGQTQAPRLALDAGASRLAPTPERGSKPRTKWTT